MNRSPAVGMNHGFNQLILTAGFYEIDVDQMEYIMRMQVRFGNPFLIFIYSSALLLIGCAIGMRWSKSPSVVFRMAFAGGALMIIHDLLMTLIWLSATAIWMRNCNRRNE